MRKTPFVIVLEGIDGAGKTTQLASLETALLRRSFSVSTTGVFRTQYGRDLRTWFMDAGRMSRATFRTQLFLLGSAMNQVAEEIASAPDSIVLVDRYIYTTMAYHGGGLGLGLEVVDEIFQPVLRMLTPDLIVVLDIPPGLIAQRKPVADRIENESLQFYSRVRQIYLSLVGELAQAVLIDAQEAEEAVHAQILETVLRAYKAQS